MAILFRRLIISLLIPFVWKKWRNRPAAQQRRDGITTNPGPVTVT
jgi:hypothetical protein